jgi:hypothetical protein
LILNVLLIFFYAGSAWADIDQATAQRILASDSAAYDKFGYSVSISGDTAVIGATGTNNTPGTTSKGAVYVFIRSGGTWVQSQKLTSPTDNNNSKFGWCVSLLGDVLVVGDPYDNAHDVISGAVFIFTRTGNSWSHNTTLYIPDGAQLDYFGKSVSISGSTIVVGARDTAYVYVYAGATWQQEQQLTSSDSVAGDAFGYSVVVSGDTVVIGAPYDDDGNYSTSGSVFVFTRSTGVWTEQVKLHASDHINNALFGWSLSLSYNTLVVGARTNNNRGAAYVFNGAGSSWSQEAKLTASDADTGDLFGESVSIYGDTVVVGAPKSGPYNNYYGAVYVYTRSDTTWTQQSKLSRTNTDDSYFGYSVSLSGDQVVVGSYNNFSGFGSAYMFGPSYSVGGTISGLEQGNSTVLQNNSGDNLTVSENGEFTFSTGLVDSSSYDVSVLSQPSGPNQECTVSSGSGTITGADITDVSISCVATYTYAVGGTVSGLAAGNSVILQNNGGDDLTVDGDGSFIFDTLLADGAGYNVTVLTDPTEPTQTCTVTNASGSSTGVDIDDVAVVCVTATHTVGGTVSGLATGNSVVLQNNGGDDLTVDANSSFTFDTAVDDGSTYSVTVLTQPDTPSQTCSVSSGSGTISGTDITNVTVSCIVNTYTVGGTATGLVAGNSVVLQNNAGDNLTVSANDGFVFASAMEDGSTYAVSVLTQPDTPGQTCSVSNGVGTIAGADVVDISVSCMTDTYVIGGTVTGLAADSSLVLQNNGGDDLTVDANSSFSFATAIDDGNVYAVTVLTQPAEPEQVCVVVDGTGTVSGDDVDDVNVICSKDGFPWTLFIPAMTGMKPQPQNM